MTWVILSLLTALSQSLRDVISKKKLRKIDEYSVSFLTAFFALIFDFVFLFLIKFTFFGDFFIKSNVFSIPNFSGLSSSFWIAFTASGTLNLLSMVVYMKAIKNSDLSVTVPMLAFSPVILIFVSPMILGNAEFPGYLSVSGILMVVIGSYLLNIKEKNLGFWKPLQALSKETGPKLMLLVAFIYSLNAISDKVGSKETSSLFWTMSINFFIIFFLGIFLIFRKYKNREVFRMNQVKGTVSIGFLRSILLLFQMTALQLTLVANVITIKRTSILISTIFGFLFFKEKDIKSRVVGATIMVLGVVFISLS
jgi:uncharacterized membrane protein